jgi:hypothetical protein
MAKVWKIIAYPVAAPGEVAEKEYYLVGVADQKSAVRALRLRHTLMAAKISPDL